MRLMYMIFPIAACISCSVAKNGANSRPGDSKDLFANNIVVAHRGAWKKDNLPQNSIASLKEAIKQKYTGSEFDVRMTADDSLVINHDPKFNGLEIEKTNYANLEAFKLSNGEKLPTLREYLIAGMENNNTTRLVCEIKPSGISKDRGEVVAGKVVKLVHKLKARQMVAYISFDYNMLKKIIKIDPKAVTQYLGGDKSPGQLKADGIGGADYYLSVFKQHPDWIESARTNHIILNAWTVDDTNDMDWLVANRFDFITTNEPELLQERIKKSPAGDGWNLVWSDEFNYNGLPDSSKWSYETGGNGWGNNELEYYTEKDTSNAIVKDGHLTIIARKQHKENREYTSARLVTKNKADFKYGRIEVRAKVSAAAGTWPAIWMLGSNIDEVGWPDCGEIDIMEHRGIELNKIFGTLHYPGHFGANGNGKTINIPTATTQFHKYALEWSASEINIFVDNQLYQTVKNDSTIPFNQKFYIILNLAIGGNFGGKVDPSFSTDAMVVDYVRVFQK